MYLISNRILKLLSLAFLLTVGYSCNKDNTEPNSSVEEPKPLQPKVGTADINFVADGVTKTIVSYKRKNASNIGYINDTTLVIDFPTTDQYGAQISNTPTFTAIIDLPSPISQGDIYNLTNGAIRVARVYDSHIYEASVGFPSSAGEIKITDLSGNRIKGTIEFSGFAQLAPSEEAIISNGEFDFDFIP